MQVHNRNDFCQKEVNQGERLHFIDQGVKRGEAQKKLVLGDGSVPALVCSVELVELCVGEASVSALKGVDEVLGTEGDNIIVVLGGADECDLGLFERAIAEGAAGEDEVGLHSLGGCPDELLPARSRPLHLAHEVAHIMDLGLQMESHEVLSAEIERYLKRRARHALCTAPSRIPYPNLAHCAAVTWALKQRSLACEEGLRVPQPVLARIMLKEDHQMI